MRIAVSMGDPGGIGPEIALKIYLAGKFPKNSFIVGDISALNLCSEMLKLNIPIKQTDTVSLDENSLNVLDLKLLKKDEIQIGQISEQNGRAAFEYIKTATKLTINSAADAIVTLPVCKEAIIYSHPDFIGHTELIAKMCNTDNYAMMIASDKLITTYVSTHVSLKNSIDMIKKKRILDVIKLTANAAKALRGFAKIAVAALNPHAGEAGKFGSEEKIEIEPAVNEAKKMGYDVSGPFSPDTIFFRAMRGEFNCVVCMYHDQGHIAMKFAGVDDAVNVTLGLPIIRTSVDHGTAFDIAYQGKASPESFIRACAMAEKLHYTYCKA